MYGREGDTLTLAAAGDAILTRRLSACEAEGFREVVDRVREADASVVNLEVLIHDYEGYPAAESGGTYMRAPPWAADEFTWMGFDMLAAATNHTGDFSHGGMEATMRELDERAIPYAGLGMNLAEAREPAYVDTPAGRVALVSACSTIPGGSQAGQQRPDMQGRPGLSPLRVDTTHVVPEETYERVQTLSEDLGLEEMKRQREALGFPVPGEGTSGFTFWSAGGDHVQFEAGEDFEIRQEADEDDAEAIEAQIRAAERQADWVIASLHCHQGADGLWTSHSAPEFMEAFARRCVDAGADAFVGHGPHLLREMEVYGGAPIFYSLGNFVMENETVTRLPADIYDSYDLGPEALPADVFDARVFEEDEDGNEEVIGFPGERAYWESVLPICRFEGGTLSGVDLYPIDLGFGEPRPRRGRPVMAEGETATRILEEFEDISAPYDLSIEIEDGVGFVPA